MSEWVSGVDTPQTVMTTRAPAVLKTFIFGDLDTTLTCAFSKAIVNDYKGLVNANIGDNEAYCRSSHCEVQSTDNCCHN